MHTDMRVPVPFKVVPSCKSAKEEVHSIENRLTLDVIAQGTAL
jgi:hypothetical protein